MWMHLSILNMKAGRGKNEFLSQAVNQPISIIQFETCSHPPVDTKGIAGLLSGTRVLWWLPLHYFLQQQQKVLRKTKSSFTLSARIASDKFNCRSPFHHNRQPSHLQAMYSTSVSFWCETVQTRRGRVQLAGGLEPLTFYDHVEQRSCCCQEGSSLPSIISLNFLHCRWIRYCQGRDVAF